MADEEKKYKRAPVVFISGVSQKTKNELEIIRKNMDLPTLSALLKPWIRKFIDECPERLKRPPID